MKRPIQWGDSHKGIRTQFWAEESERRTWEQAADDRGLSLSAWLRRAANKVAEMEGKTK